MDELKSPEDQIQLQGTEGLVYVQFRPLGKAIEKGDLKAVRDFLRLHPEAVRTKLSHFGGTAVHLTSASGKLEMVEEMMELVTEEDIQVLDINGSTALAAAAGVGATSIAECMIKKNSKLVEIPGQHFLPVTMACNNGHKDTAKYLYSITPFELLLPENGKYGSLLLHVSIFNHVFDISLDLLQRCPNLATTRNHLETTPLIQFSALSDLFPSGLRFVFCKRWIYSCLYPLRRLGSNLHQVLGQKQIYDTKLTHVYALEPLHLMSEEISTVDDSKINESGLYEAFRTAIKYGVIEIVIEMLKANPVLLTVADINRRSIIHYAVQHRQQKIFNLIYVSHTRNYMLTSGIDNQKNNILHIAAMLAPPDRLACFSGAALQMQKELQWYKEVESIVDPSLKEYININNERPRQTFSNRHKQLVSDGEKWIKETATSCTVVGALIITIMFTAAFAVPGGNVQVTGFPIFLHKIVNGFYNNIRCNFAPCFLRSSIDVLRSMQRKTSSSPRQQS